MAQQKKSALFICLGNICRSPMAEAVFRHILKQNESIDDWEVDSAALGSWHVGKGPDRRTNKVLKRNGIDYTHKVRQITKEDFKKFDFIFGMDDSNMKELDSMKPSNSKAELILLGTYDPEGERIIRDPYYDDDDAGFEKCYEQCVRSCTAFLQKHS
ncbi:Low molecular weight phosphotyrosine protein phosphatase [Blattella germanica]|nr:Low molecular weight phosphotyrosine protein phosphatase [Blattella germanica]